MQEVDMELPGRNPSFLSFFGSSFNSTCKRRSPAGRVTAPSGVGVTGAAFSPAPTRPSLAHVGRHLSSHRCQMGAEADRTSPRPPSRSRRSDEVSPQPLFSARTQPGPLSRSHSAALRPITAAAHLCPSSGLRCLSGTVQAGSAPPGLSWAST